MTGYTTSSAALERDTGVALSGSPTQRVGYEVLSELPKETHESPMLSLDKTKSVEDPAGRGWGTRPGLLSWKMDGLTIVLTYDGGSSGKGGHPGKRRDRRGDHQQRQGIHQHPLKHLRIKGELVLRGEAVILYSDFQRINEEIEDVDAKYKNPRNLCSGSVRQLNNARSRRSATSIFRPFPWCGPRAWTSRIPGRSSSSG